MPKCLRWPHRGWPVGTRRWTKGSCTVPVVECTQSRVLDVSHSGCGDWRRGVDIWTLVAGARCVQMRVHLPGAWKWTRVWTRVTVASAGHCFGGSAVMNMDDVVFSLAFTVLT